MHDIVAAPSDGNGMPTLRVTTSIAALIAAAIILQYFPT